MHELIVTVVTDSDASDYATYTEVYRYIFETHAHLEQALADMTRYTRVVAGGKMYNQAEEA